MGKKIYKQVKLNDIVAYCVGVGLGVAAFSGGNPSRDELDFVIDNAEDFIRRHWAGSRPLP